MTIDPDINDNEDIEASPFGQFLFCHRDGKTHAELSAALALVSEAVLSNGGTGTITLKITVKPSGDEKRLVVQDEVKVTPPKPFRERSIWFYNDAQKGLSRRDPRQGELDLTVIPMRPRSGSVIATDRDRQAGA